MDFGIDATLKRLGLYGYSAQSDVLNGDTPATFRSTPYSVQSQNMMYRASPRYGILLLAAGAIGLVIVLRGRK